MELIFEVLVTGFLISTLYALISVGFSMIFGVAGVLNLAHGAFAVLGGYVAIWTRRWIDNWLIFGFDEHVAEQAIETSGFQAFFVGALPVIEIIVASLVAIAAVALFAPLIYTILIRPLQDKPVVVFLATLLLGVVMEQVFLLIAGLNTQILPPFIEGSFQMFSQEGVRFSGFPVLYNRLLAAGVAILLIAALWLYISRTKSGKAILAVSMDRKGAALSGIPTDKVVLRVWAISGALAAIAGIFAASFLGISPFEDRPLTVLAFSIVVLGGLGSIPGSLIASMIIGFAETIPVVVSNQFNSAQGLISLAILLIVLIAKPHGLFGRPHH